MVNFNSLVAFSIFGLGALAHPTIKHIDRRFCSLEKRSFFARTEELTSRATIPKATSWNPPSNLVTALDQVWKQTMKENPQGLQDKNWIFDQLIANNGSLNYCVRWNYGGKSTAAARASTVQLLQRSMQKWFDILVGFEGFPLNELNVNVVGYAVKDKRLIEGDISGLDIYTTADNDGVPECDTRCYRAFHLDGDMSQCPGDESLTGKMGGVGYNWGQELGPDYLLNNLDKEDLPILLHEMGHGLGLLDYYHWVPQGQTNFIMRAGSATEITEFDAWMLRGWYRKLKAERNY